MEKTFWNNHDDHLSALDLKGARIENRGQITKLKPNGIPFNHIREVKCAQNGLFNVIQGTKAFLKLDEKGDFKKPLTPEQKERAEKLLSQASKWLDKTEKYLPRTGTHPPKGEADELLHSDAIFKIAQALVAKYKQKYGFDLDLVETLFMEMKNDTNHPGWELWNTALTDAAQGKAREWLRGYRSSVCRDNSCFEELQKIAQVQLWDKVRVYFSGEYGADCIDSQ